MKQSIKVQKEVEFIVIIFFFIKGNKFIEKKNNLN